MHEHQACCVLCHASVCFRAGLRVCSCCCQPLPRSHYLRQPRTCGCCCRCCCCCDCLASCLQSLARQNPAALNRLSGFRVERAGFGSLEWLAPVDVRGVDLGDVISIERGEVAVYVAAEGCESAKPPVGSGLNVACRVTLTGVLRRPKQQQAAAAAAAAFRKRLARYCSEMGARFVDYKPDGGVWVFEVDHFSRYGVPMDEDSDAPDDDGDGFDTPGGRQPHSAPALLSWHGIDPLLAPRPVAWVCRPAAWPPPRSAAGCCCSAACCRRFILAVSGFRVYVALACGPAPSAYQPPKVVWERLSFLGLHFC
ncbi:hypothetical protein COO60DRAFT_1266863 [Scenedesmus sp. NREL 46B-D3]|nr:hypothetical protein COO60DRAFT_1266863 [Scenedesmus sp. NREL 46B-D3]